MKTQSLISFVTLALFASSSLANPVPIPGSIGYKESWRATRDVNEDIHYKRLQYRQVVSPNSPDVAGTAQTEVSSVKGALQGAAAGGANPVVGLMGNVRRGVGSSGAAVNELLTKGGSGASDLGVTDNIPKTDAGTLAYEASAIQGGDADHLVQSSPYGTPLTTPVGTTMAPVHIPLTAAVDDGNGNDGKASMSKSVVGSILGGGSKSGSDMTTPAGNNDNPLFQATQPFGVDGSSIDQDPNAISGDFGAISNTTPGLHDPKQLTKSAFTPNQLADPLHGSAIGSMVGNPNMTPENMNQDLNGLAYDNLAHGANTGVVQSGNPVVAGLGSIGATNDAAKTGIDQVTALGGGANFLGGTSGATEENPFTSIFHSIFPGSKASDSSSHMTPSSSIGGSKGGLTGVTGPDGLMDNHSGAIPLSGSHTGLLSSIGLSPASTGDAHGDKSAGGIASFFSGLFGHGSSNSSPTPDTPGKGQDAANGGENGKGLGGLSPPLPPINGPSPGSLPGMDSGASSSPHPKGPDSGGVSLGLPIPTENPASGSFSLSLPLPVPTGGSGFDNHGAGSDSPDHKPESGNGSVSVPLSIPTGIINSGSGSDAHGSGPGLPPIPGFGDSSPAMPRPTPDTSSPPGAEMPSLPASGMGNAPGSPSLPQGNGGNKPPTPGSPNGPQDPMMGSGITSPPGLGMNNSPGSPSSPQGNGGNKPPIPDSPNGPQDPMIGSGIPSPTGPGMNNSPGSPSSPQGNGGNKPPTPGSPNGPQDPMMGSGITSPTGSGMNNSPGSPSFPQGNGGNKPPTPDSPNGSHDSMMGSTAPNSNAGPATSNPDMGQANSHDQGSSPDQGAPPNPGHSSSGSLGSVPGLGGSPPSIPGIGDALNGPQPPITVPSTGVSPPSIPALDTIGGNAGMGDNGDVQVDVGTGGDNTNLGSSSKGSSDTTSNHNPFIGPNGLHFGPGPVVINSPTSSSGSDSPSKTGTSNPPAATSSMSGSSSAGPKGGANPGPVPTMPGNVPPTSQSMPFGPGSIILSNPYGGYTANGQWSGASPYPIPSMFPYQYIDGKGWVAPDGSLVPAGSIFPGIAMNGAAPFTSMSGILYQYMPGKGWVGSDGSVYPFQYVDGQGWFGSAGGATYAPNNSPYGTSGFMYGQNTVYGAGASSGATGGGGIPTLVKKSGGLMHVDGAGVDPSAVNSYVESALEGTHMKQSRWFKNVPLNDAMSAEPVPTTLTTAEDTVAYPLNMRRSDSNGDNANRAAAAGAESNNNNAGQNGNENGNNNGTQNANENGNNNGGQNGGGNRALANNGNNVNEGNQGEENGNGANVNGAMANNGNNERNGANGRNGNVRAHANQGAGGVDRYNYEMTDLQALNYLLTLEEFETAFYEEALQRFSEEDFVNVGYPRWVRPRYDQILSHERVHKEFLQSAITSAGQNYVEPCNYELSNVNDPRNFVEYSEAVQSIITSAYVGILRYFNERSYITAGASMLAVEARQAAWINSAVRHKNPWNSAFETALTPSQVYTLLSNFFDFQSLTEENRALLPVGITPAPRLSLAPRLLPGQQGEVSFPYPSLNEHECLYVVFLTGAANIVAPLIDQHNGHYFVEIPLELEGAGTVYIVVIRGSDNIGDVSVSDQTTVAGPAIAEFPYNAEGRRGNW